MSNFKKIERIVRVVLLTNVYSCGLIQRNKSKEIVYPQKSRLMRTVTTNDIFNPRNM